jgi:hypothetical protein
MFARLLGRSLILIGAVIVGRNSPGGRVATAPRSPSQGHPQGRRTRALLAVFLLFSVLAFDEDFLAAANDILKLHIGSEEFATLVLALDVIGLGLLAAAASRARSDPGDPTKEATVVTAGASRWWFIAGSASILALDSTRLFALPYLKLTVDLWLIMLYIPALAALLVFVLDLDLGRARATGPAHAQKVDDFFAALPLLAGTAAAFIGQRLYGDQLTTIDTNYFSQVTQVIPLLLVALGVERRWFEPRGAVRPIRWAVTVYTVGILAAGEALAISTLPNNAKAEGKLTAWHEYIAFAITLYACFVALAAVVIALLRVPPNPGNAAHRES